MARTHSSSKEIKRLNAVQARVRELALMHDWFSEVIQMAFTDFLELSARYIADKSAIRDHERELARKVLASGRIFDPACRDTRPCVFVKVEGLCPAAVAEQIQRHLSDGDLPKKLQRDSARAALAALDRDTVYQSRDLPETKREAMAREYRSKIEAGTHISFVWRIVVARPDHWQKPANPHSLDLIPLIPAPIETGNLAVDVPAFAAWVFAGNNTDYMAAESELAQFNKSDYRTIALYRLGGLANSPTVDPSQFPLDVAEQMLAHITQWVAEQLNERSIKPASKPNGADNDSRAETVAFPCNNALTPDHESILAVLGKTPMKCQLVVDVSGAGSIRNRETVGRLLRELSDFGLVDRPHGQRKGYALTDLGRKVLSDILPT